MTGEKLKKKLKIVIITGVICFVGVSFYNKLINIIIFRSYFWYDENSEIVLIDNSDIHISSGQVNMAKISVSTESYDAIRNATAIHLTYESLTISFGIMLLTTLFLSLLQLKKNAKLKVKATEK
jgi:hypothetical protein